MASQNDIILRELERKHEELKRLLAQFLATLLKEISSTLNTNRAIKSTNELIDLLKESQKNGFENPNVYVSKYSEEFTPEIMESLENSGIAFAYVDILGEGPMLVVEKSERAREVLHAIRTGTDEIIANATKIVAIDPSKFGAQHSNEQCVEYTNLNARQVEEFRKKARQGNFQFGLAEEGGKFTVIVTKEIAEKHDLNTFAKECATYNRSGIVSIINDMEAEQRQKAKNQIEHSANDKGTRYYLNLKHPDTYVKVTDTTITLHTPHKEQTFSRDKVDVQEFLTLQELAAERAGGVLQEMSAEKFKMGYCPGASDYALRKQFIEQERFVSETKKHSMLVQQIGRMVEQTPDFNPEKSIIKHLGARVKSMSAGPAKDASMRFLEDYAKSDRMTRISMLQSDKVPVMINDTELSMMQKICSGEMKRTEFVYSTIMARAETLAEAKGDKELLDLIKSNAFNVDKIESMLETQNPIKSGIVLETQPDLADKFNELFSNAMCHVTHAEINNNISFIAQVQDTLNASKILQTAETMKYMASDEPEILAALTAGTIEEQMDRVGQLMTGKTPIDIGYEGIDNMKLSDKMVSVFNRAYQQTINSPQFTLETLAESGSLTAHAGDTMFADVLSAQTISDMLTASRSVTFKELSGQDVEISHGGRGGVEELMGDIKPNTHTQDEQTQNKTTTIGENGVR